MTVVAPTVGAIVQFTPGRADRRAGYFPAAAIVVGVTSNAGPDFGVVLTAFLIDGGVVTRGPVMHKDTWTTNTANAAFDADGTAYWTWPAVTHL